MTEREHVGIAVLALGAVGVAAGLEGGYEPRMGAVAYALLGLAAAWTIARGEVPALSRPVQLAIGLLAGVILVQVLPLPAALRGLLAPGLAERLDWAAGLPPVPRAEWLAALARFDLDVLLGTAGTYDFDPLAGARDEAWRPLALSFPEWAWRAGQWAAAASAVVVGWRLSRSRPALLLFLLGLLGLALFEAFFGFANRNGPSTGIGKKVSYLGYATGTFINRGHFAAFLVMGIGAAWSLAASIFPLLPEEVRRHARRKRRSSQPPGVMEASGDKLPRLSLLAFAVGLLSVAMLAAASRGPIVSLVLAGLALGAWTRWRRDDGVHLGIGLGVPVAGLLLAALTAGPFGAVRRFLALGSDESLSSRVLSWRASVDAWLESPILGSGAGSWTQAVSPHERAAHLYDLMHAHSEPVELLVELGVVGLAAVAALLGLAMRAIAQRLDVVEHDLRSATAVGLGVALLAVAMQSLGDFPLRTPGVLVPAAVLAGVVLGALDIGKPGGRRWPIAGLVAVATLATVATGVVDARSPGTRAERISDMAPVLLLEGADPEASACAAASREPSRAWAH
ncbi:MAG: O-antigen ligase family protein, partial [Deltaproteobacteria bacterium]|nr:O-antigen ligase family protein [Deltaproteobacteria bacterium]